MPFVRIMIPFVMGIQFASRWDMTSVGIWATAGAGFITGWLWLGRLPPGSAWRLEPLRGAAVILCIFTAGGLTLIGKRNAQAASDHPLPLGESAKGWICTLEESPQRKKNSFRAIASIDILMNEGRTYPGGRGLIYFSADSRSPTARIGDRLFTTVQPEPLKGPEYPGGFDAAGYFERQGISYRLFLKPTDWIVLDSTGAPWLNVTLERIRKDVIRILGLHIHDLEALGLAEALLIGYRNDLDERVSDAYSETGVIHVIAISGLHIGVIFSLLSGLLNVLLRGQGMRWVATLCALLGIWGFGLLAGGGPSVMRSVCMFSIIGVGKTLTGREGNGLNTLAAVACLMLAAQPWWLWDLGFQLSFTAVASLMIFYRPVLGLLPIRNLLASKIWEMTAVTLSAQILTTPLLLQTFGRFPVFFLITNMVAIPLSTIILLGELALCLVARLNHDLAEKCGSILTTMIRGLNDYIFRMESIPFGTLENIHLSIGEMACFYLFIACVVGWRLLRSSTWLMAALMSLAFSGVLHEWFRQLRARQQILVVMPLSRTRLVMLIDGNTARWLETPFGPQDPRQTRMAMRATALHFGIERQYIDTIPASCQFKCTWNGLNLLLLSKNGTVSASDLITADFVILSGNGPPQVEKMIPLAPRAIWIADGTNRLWKILQWETAAERLPLRLISTRRSGAFTHYSH
jgi:competence protein ComEC